MGSISPSTLHLARHMLAQEAARGKKTDSGASGPPGHPAVLVCEKLRTVLTAFAGVAGFRSLLSRALTLAAAKAPALKGVAVNADGSLSGIEHVESGKSNSAAPEWEEVLVAHLLDLLVTFVGEGLTHQFVSQAWPALPAGTIRSKTEDKS